MSVEIFKRFMNEAFAKGDLSVVDELVSPELVDHQFGLEGTGREAVEKVKRAITDLHGFMHDVHYTFDDVIAVGDMVWARMTCTATHSGPLFGRPATGRSLRITVIDVCRFKDGQIIEHWGVPDRFALLAQTGLLEALKGSA